MDTRKIKEISKGIVEIKNAGNTVWGGGVPGPKKLIGGTMQAGFFGEVPVSRLISGDELAKLIGLFAGASINSNEPWLKFAYMGNIEYIAKKHYRHGLSWDDINAVNAVYGDRIIEINKNKYRVRLIKGKTEGKQDDKSFFEGAINHNSEWNRLLLPIHENAPSNWKYPENVKSPTEDWGVDYSDSDLYTKEEEGEKKRKSSSWSWCQEYGLSPHRLVRGTDEVSYSSYANTGLVYGACGWRPVLEFVK